jgi:hypothetical protein
LDQVDAKDDAIGDSFDSAVPAVRVRFRGHPEPLPLTPFTQPAALEFGFVRQPREST